MSKEPLKNGFTAEACNFQETFGYMLHQWRDCVCVCSQFVPQEHFTKFCSVAGIEEKQIIFNS